MTTFTLQDLTPEQQQAVAKHEEMHKMFQDMGNVFVGEGKSNVFEAPTTQPTVTKEEWMEYGMNNPISVSPTTQDILGAPVPQPSGENPHNIGDIVNAICTQLQLLTTVISQSKAQPEAGENSLQETVALVLQQADWFKTMVHEKAEELVDDKDFDYQIESAVETHFSNSFSLDDHVDITAEVESKVEDIAEDLLKDIVQEQLEEVVAERLKSIRVVFD